MSITAKDFLNFAEWLNNFDANDEIGQRCAISRAYYGAFHAAIESLGIDDYENHQSVIKEIKALDFTLGAMLYDLKKRRVEADYRLSLDDFSKDDVFWFIEMCKDFMGKIRNIG
jgi:uncharacterized protein (UPF0332 family)